MTISINAPVRAVGLAMLAALAVACGGGDEKPAAKGAESPAAAGKAPKNVVETPGTAADDGLANAVAVGKAAAAVDLKYNLPVRPEAGQPFEVELVFLPRIPADTLDVQATGMPGLIVAGGATATFAQVVVGERYVAKVLLQAPEPGLYYVGVTAKLTTETQTDARTFSVPVVIGVLPAVEKAAPVKSGAGGGENVETTKAAETTKAVETTK
jgi:hypothetical protein